MKPISKPVAKPLMGIEKCPKCGALQDKRDQITKAGIAESEVTFWACHACGHTFRIWRDQVLEPDWWPARKRSGGWGLVKVTTSVGPREILLRREEK